MSIQHTSELTREEIHQFTGAVMLEFGAEWCEHCQAAQSMIASALKLHPNIRHIKIEDGKGRKLGRTFSVKLWPTLIFMKDGIELKRLVRQINPKDIASAFIIITTAVRS
jgi:thioredoxin 1